MKKLINIIFVVLMLSSCSDSSKAFINNHDGSSSYKVGNPYEVFGKTYYPKEDYNYKERGIASWYGADFHEGITANGEKYNMHDMTAAHRTLPLPSVVRVINLRNQKSVILRVNDRGPFVNNRIIDVSKRAAEILGFKNQGTTEVIVEILPEESKMLKASLTGKKTTSYNTSKPLTSFFDFGTPLIEEYNLINIDPEPSTFDKGGFDENSDFDIDDAKIHFVQLGAFENRENALNLREKIILSNSFLANEQVGVYQTLSGNKTLYRVRIGPYKKSIDALRTYNKVNDIGISGAKIVSDK